MFRSIIVAQSKTTALLMLLLNGFNLNSRALYEKTTIILFAIPLACQSPVYRMC